MAFALVGRQGAALAAIMLVTMALSACTTTEGTNALTSIANFDEGVLEPTAQGIGLAPAPVKADPTNPRGPLVLPKDTSVLPPPEKDTTTAMLPADDSKPKVNSEGLSGADLDLVKHARVVDVNTPDGRPLTQAELAKLTGHMKGYTLSSKRSIFTPPEQYFSLSGNQQDLVCLATSGDIVSVNDPNCPASIRAALLKKKS